MKAKKEANLYDKIFKENLEAVTMALVEKVLEIKVLHSEKIQADLPKTLERKPDQLLKITDTSGQTFILHLEFQLSDDSEMAERMLEYWILLRRKYKLSIRQYVFFLADTKPKMSVRLREDEVSYRFHLIPISQVDYHTFLGSDNPEEAVFAILGDFGKRKPEKVAGEIAKKITATAQTPLQVEKHLEQLRVLANLRKLQPFIETIMESIAKYIKEENDPFYIKGMRIGMEKGIEKGMEKSAKELEKRNRLFVKNLLSKTDFPAEKIAELAAVSVDFVEEIKKTVKKKV